jgi:hypothetical protein
VPPTPADGNVRTKFADVSPGASVTLAGETAALLVPPAGLTTTVPVNPLAKVTGIFTAVVKPSKPAAEPPLTAKGTFSPKAPDAATEMDPPAATPVKLKLPDCALDPIVAVKVAPEFDGQETLWLEGDTLTPLGAPAELTFTFPLNPAAQLTLTVTGADAPAKLATGTTDSVKPGTNVKLADVVCVSPSVVFDPVKVSDPDAPFSVTL